MKSPDSFFDKLKALPKLKELSYLAPKIVKRAPAQEVQVREGLILDRLPVLKCWPKDGGRFLTLPLVVTKDPETGVRNIGMYRMQVYDNRTTGMHWQIHKDGALIFQKAAKKGMDRLEAAVAIGGDPAAVYASSAPLPYGIDEYMFAGFLRTRPLELVKCKTVDLEVPAESDIVLEGYVDIKKMRAEGPFGDHTGFYTPVKDFPVFNIEMMTMRKDPIYMATAVGKPPMEDCFMGYATERIFLPMLQKQLPEIRDIHLPFEGIFHNCILISIRKSFPHQARKVMQAVWGLGQMMFSKCILVFDEAVDVQNVREAAFRALSNIDPKRDVVFSEGPVDQLDHSAPQDFFGSKMGIDATTKTPEEGMIRPWPEEIKMDEQIVKKVTARWREYGF
jgi:4-hydroxy-3-polyprenylbenzoate decarboxylase